MSTWDNETDIEQFQHFGTLFEFNNYVEKLGFDELTVIWRKLDFCIQDIYRLMKSLTRTGKDLTIKPYLSSYERKFLLENSSVVDFSDLKNGTPLHVPFSPFEQFIILLVLGFDDKKVVIGSTQDFLDVLLYNRQLSDVLKCHEEMIKRKGFIKDDNDCLYYINCKVTAKSAYDSSFSSFFNKKEMYYNRNLSKDINDKIPYLYYPISTIDHNSGPITEIALYTDHSGHTKKTYIAAGCCVNQPDIQKDNFITSILDDGYINVWSAHNEILDNENNNNNNNATEGNYSTISDVKISNNGKYIYTSGFDKRVEVWDRKTFTPQYIVGQQHKANINRLAVHLEYFDQEIVASCADDGVVIIYNEKEDNGYSSSDSEENEVGNWRQEKIYYSSSYSACDITFGIKNCTNYLFTGFECENGGIIKIFDIYQMEMLYRKKYPGRISCISLSPTGKLLSCGTFIGSDDDQLSNDIYLIDTETQTHINIETPQNDINLILWSRDGQKIVSCSTDDTGIIYDIRYLSRPLTTIKHQGFIEPDGCGIVSAKWMNNTDVLITGGTDSTLRFWDLNLGDPEIHSIFLNDSSVSSISLTDDDEWLCAGTNNGCVKVYSIDRDFISLWDKNNNNNNSSSSNNNANTSNFNSSNNTNLNSGSNNSISISS
jgi:WD40 repeat protein